MDVTEKKDNPTHITQLLPDDIIKLNKLNKILESMEKTESEHRKKLNTNPNLMTYTKLLDLFHKNYEISTLTANELAAHLNLLNLSIISAILQKIVHRFQVQLKMFLQFQVNFFRKGKDLNNVSSFEPKTVFPEAKPISLNTGTNSNNKPEEKNFLNNNSIKSFSTFDILPPMKRLIPEFYMDSSVIAVSSDNLGEEIVDLNYEMKKHEATMYNLNLIEARNIANNTELKQISKEYKLKKNSNVINEKKDNSIKKHKKNRKVTIEEVNEILEQTNENKNSPSDYKLTKIDKKVNTRTQGTTPDTDIFDINIIYELEEIIKTKETGFEELQEKLNNREKTIKELESTYSFLKMDYNSLKENYENFNLKFAESKVIEANLNIELSNYRKEANNLKKEIGLMEVKLEKKEYDSFSIKNTLADQIKIKQDLENKLKETKELNLKFELKYNEVKAQNLEILEENRDLKDEITEIKAKTEELEKPFIEEKHLNFVKITGLEEKIKELEETIKKLRQEIVGNKHLLYLKEIEKDKILLKQTVKYNFSNKNESLIENSTTKTSSLKPTSNNLIKNDQNDIIDKEVSVIDNKNNNPINTINTIPNKYHLQSNTSLESYKPEFQVIAHENITDEEQINSIINLDNLIKEENSDDNQNIKSKILENEYFDSDKLLQEILKAKGIEKILWPEVYEFLDKIMIKSPSSAIYDIKNSNNNQIKIENLSNYSDIMNKILTPSNKFSIISDYNASKPIKTLESKPSMNISDAPIYSLSQFSHNNQYQSNKKPQIGLNPILSQINMSQLSQKSHNFNKNKSNHIKNSSIALKQQLKSDESFSKEYTKENKNLHRKNSSLFKFESETVLNEQKPMISIRPDRKIQNHSMSSSTIRAEMIKIEESPLNFNSKNYSPRNQKELWDMAKDERDNIFENMYTKFGEIQEKLLSSQKNHRQFLKHVVLINHIKKEINGGDFIGDTQMPKLEEFKEFMEGMLNKHRKCGKDCSHLKRFYEKIGYTNGEITNYSNRIEFKPKKMTINSLPKI